jgi:hypothetical protein
MDVFTIDDAIVMVVIAHRGQRDKGRPNLPYLMHPLRVMDAFDDETLQMIAVLHDAVEDGPLTLEEVREAGAPSRVVSGIDALTHRVGESDETYWARVREDPDAVAVKLEDIKDNSDPERLKSLPVAEAERLSEKYARARAALGSVARSIPDDLRDVVAGSGGTVTEFDSRRSDQRELVLENTAASQGGTRDVTISMDSDGTFRWRVTYLHRDGSSDYEWLYAVPPDRVPKLVHALEGHEGEDVLELVQRRHAEGRDIPELLKGEPVNGEFSNWIS